MRCLFPVLSILLTLALAGCACLVPPEKAKKEEPFYLKRASFAALPGWDADSQSETLAAFRKSCARIVKKDGDKTFGPATFAGTYAAWQAVCENLPGAGGDAAARAYFAQNFTPYRIWDEEDGEGLFTGYYEPLLKGALVKKKPYLIPLYARPSGMITVNLGDFREEWKGESITGRVDKDRLVPYFTRAEIEKGALKDEEKIVWVDGAVDAFFLHIQGSGQVRMENGDVLRVGYAAQNGRPYTAIGKELISRGALTKDNVSMQAIRDWLEKNPEEAPEVMNLNASYVFFRKLGGDGPLGAEGVALTPRRSLAVDRRKFPYGAPFWIDVEAPGEEGARLRRLMVAQDTGGAIKGAVRGDFFWGAGAEAAAQAGVMKSRGQAWILLPNAVEVPESHVYSPWRHRGDGPQGFVYND